MYGWTPCFRRLCLHGVMSQTRRAFLSTLGATAAGLATGRRAFGGLVSSTAKIPKIGIQLYTMRRPAESDLAGVLRQLATTGYKEVELAGYYKHTASEVRDLLKQNGLTAPSSHIGLDAIEASPAQTFDDAKTIGHEWITVPSLPRGKRETADDWKSLADRFNKGAKQAKEAGFRFAFHNHADVIKPVGDVVPIDVLMKETDPSLVSFQMDIYWVVNGGADPLALLGRYPGRFKMLHVKDSAGPPDNKMTDVGAGTIDFKKIFAAAHGIEHYFVENDYPVDAFACAATSYRYLSSLEF
jgi:sugar phosphate isomerase/epimerase